MKSTTVLRAASQVFKGEEELARKMSHLLPYTVPRWASKLKNQPKYYVELARKPTPIHEWNLRTVPKQFDLDIKRDDLTGHMLSGSKIRKLEFIFADAILRKSTCVITCGNVQSNHCRATAIAAKQLGLDCHLLLRSHDPEEDVKVTSANMLLCRVHGAECYTVPYQPLPKLDERLYRLARELKKTGERPYIIPHGGSDYLGTFGVINSFRELINQDVLSKYDDIVVASSSGGTLTGLAIANYLTGEKVKIHGVSVSEDYKFFHSHIKDTLLAYGLPRAKACQICDVIDGYKGAGYSATTQHDLDTLVRITRDSGILLDYTYTLKAVKGMLNEMNENPKRFKGNRVLFIHTGGTFSIFDGQVADTLINQHSDNVHVWKDSRDNPLKWRPKKLEEDYSTITQLE